LIFDLRPLLHGNISGVEVFTKNMVRELVKTASPSTNIIFWVNARKKFDFGEFKTMGTCVQTHIPNLLFNLSASLFRWPKIDKMILAQLSTFNFVPSSRDSTLFVPDPRPSPVSSQCQKIVTVHDLSAFRFPEAFNWKTRLLHQLIRLKKELIESAKVIAVSKFTKQEIIDYRLCEAEKIEVIHEAAEFDDDLVEKKPKESLPKNFFFSLSTLEPRKNIEKLIQGFLLAHKENPRLSLVLVGRKNTKIFSKLNITNHPNITFIERFISIAEKKWLYQNATGFLFLSKYEGFGLPILEAMSQGCPVICGNNSAQKEVAGTAGILVDVQNIPAIARAILDLEGDEELKKRLSERSLAHAKIFSWKKSAVKIHTIFNF
jgi:glycosyltransferase involved in cell wall biosynthesis